MRHLDECLLIFSAKMNEPIRMKFYTFYPRKKNKVHMGHAVCMSHGKKYQK